MTLVLKVSDDRNIMIFYVGKNVQVYLFMFFNVIL